MHSRRARSTVLDAASVVDDSRRGARRRGAGDRFFGAAARIRRCSACRCAPRPRKRCATPQRGDVALVFGNEMSGLSNAELARCQIVATIPSNPDFASLNLAAAVQVAAYELRVAACGDAVWSAPAFEPATQDEIAQLFAHGERALIALNFLRPAQPKRLLPRLRRLFARARLEKEEVNILRGIVARIEERLGRADRSA